MIRENAIIGLMFLPMPLSLFIGGFLILGTRLGLAALIIRSSTNLSRTLERGIQILKDDYRLLLLPALSAVAVICLLTTVVWKSIHDPSAASQGGREIIAEAWRIVLTPRIISAYFIAGFCLIFSNAILIYCFLYSVKGERANLISALIASCRIIHAILLLSLSIFGIFLFLKIIQRKIKSSLRLPLWLSELLEFAGLFLESGILITTQLIFAVMFSEGLSLRLALKKVAVIVRREDREILKAAFGMATLRYEACVAMFLCPWGACVLAVPYFGDNYLLAFTSGFLLGILFSAIYFSLVMAIEGVLAAGIYIYGTAPERLRGFQPSDFYLFHHQPPN